MALITAPSQRSTQSSIWNLQLPAETVSETNTSPRGTHQTTRRQKETGLCFPHTGDGNCPRLLLIERWVANEAGHTALPWDPAAQVNAYFTPSEPRSRKGEREKDREFCLGGYECGSWVPPKPPVSWLLLSTVWAHKGVQASLQATRDSVTPFANLFDHLLLQFCVFLLYHWLSFVLVGVTNYGYFDL